VCAEFGPDAVPALAVALARHGGDLSTAASAFAALRNIVGGHNPLALKFMEVGGVAPFMEAARAHGRDETAAKAVAGAIQNLAFKTELGVPLFINGAKPALMAAVAAFPGVKAVADEAMRRVREGMKRPFVLSEFLWLLNSEAPNGTIMEKVRKLVEKVRKYADLDREAAAVLAGVPVFFPALVGALQQSANEAGPCRDLANVLRSMAAGGYEDACVSAGAVPELVALLSRHAGDKVVVEEACGALKNILAGPFENAVVASGAIPALVGALARHEGDAAVCKSACGALANIVWSNASHRGAAVAAGAVPRLAAAWAAHPGAKPEAHAALEKMGFRDSGRVDE
jgi:hypothetical protein